MSSKKIIGIALIAAGVVLLVLGIYQIVEFRQSLAGKLSSLGNKLSRQLSGKTSIADEYIKPIILIVCGAAAGVFGFVLFKKR
jgi:sulfite exporter TauE/SafE